MAAAAATCFQACRLRGRSPSSRALPAVAEDGGEQSEDEGHGEAVPEEGRGSRVPVEVGRAEGGERSAGENGLRAEGSEPLQRDETENSR